MASLPNCDTSGNGPGSQFVSGGDLFVECATPNSGAPETVARVNLTTNKVVKTYLINMIEHKIVVAGGALWVDATGGSACTDPCIGFHHLLRFDLATGKQTRDLVDLTLRGVGFGYVLAADLSGHLVKLDSATGDSVGQIPFAYPLADVACGSLWGRDATTTTVTRVDPASGNVLGSFTEPGTVGEIQQVGDECWAVAYSGSDSSASYHFIRVSSAGIDFRSPTYPTGTRAAIFDGTFWVIRDGTYGTRLPAPSDSTNLTTMQRIDPATWRPAGPIWTYTGAAPAFGAGGSLWAANTPAGGTTPTAIDRLDVPLGAIGS